MKEAARRQLAGPASPSFSFIDKPVDRSGDGQWILVLPHSDDRPTGFFEQCDGLRVTFTGSRELGLPPFGIGRRRCAVFRAGVPKAPVYEHSHTCAEEDHVRSASQGPQRSGVHPIPEPKSVEFLAERQLRWSIPLAHVAHPLADEWRRCPRRWTDLQLRVSKLQMDKPCAALSLAGLSRSAITWLPSRSSTLEIARRPSTVNLGRTASSNILRTEEGATAASLTPEASRSGTKLRRVRLVCCDDSYPRRGSPMPSRSIHTAFSTGIKAVRANSTKELRVVSSNPAIHGSERPTKQMVEDSGEWRAHQVGGGQQ